MQITLNILILFLLLFSVLEHVSKLVISLIYDIALFANNENDLQQLVCRVAKWCDKNHLAMNINKTKVLHIRPKRRARSFFSFACNSTIIDYCNEYKYLGIWFNEFLDCKQTLEHTARSSRKALAGVCARSKEFGVFLYQT